MNDQYDAVGTRESTVEDMRWLAQRGEHHGVKIAFESWNFAPRNNEWEATWEIVQAVVSATRRLESTRFHSSLDSLHSSQVESG